MSRADAEEKSFIRNLAYTKDSTLKSINRRVNFTLYCRYLCFTEVTRTLLFSVEILDINHGFVFLGLNDIPL